MLATLKKTSPRRHLAGTFVAVTLALTMAAVAWAANPETSGRETVIDEQFAFDIEVTVDGRSQAGILTLTGDTAVSSIGGQPRMLADDTLRLEHRDDESGWAAEVTIDRMPDEKFSVTATISRNGEVVSAPRMIIGADSPASIETRDPDTDELAYRLVLTPVDPPQPESPGTGQSDSAMLLLTVNEVASVLRQVQWPRATGDSMLLNMSQDGEPEPWNAWVGLQRLEGDRIELCLESFHVQGVTRSIMDKKGCMILDAGTLDNAYMRGGVDDAGISWRLDMVPNAQ